MILPTCSPISVYQYVLLLQCMRRSVYYTELLSFLNWFICLFNKYLSVYYLPVYAKVPVINNTEMFFAFSGFVVSGDQYFLFIFFFSLIYIFLNVYINWYSFVNCIFTYLFFLIVLPFLDCYVNRSIFLGRPFPPQDLKIVCPLG